MVYKIKQIFILLVIFFLLSSCSRSTHSYNSAQCVDRFLGALSSGDYDSAYYLQSERVRSQLPLEDFRDLNRLSYQTYQIESQTWKILGVAESTETATVYVSITSNFQDKTSVTKEGKYALVKENGEWHIDAVYPVETQSP